MRTRSRVLTAGLVTLCLGIVMMFPARVAYRWFAPPTVAMGGISGSVWNGRAREANVSGVYLRDLTWRFRPGAMFTAKLAFQVEASPTSGFVEGIVAVGITGGLALTDLQASLPLQSLQQVLAMSGLAGKLNVRFDRLQLDRGLPVAADGVVEVADLVAPNLYRSSVGGYRAEFFTQESGVMASVEDTDGLIDLAGSLQISSDRSYQFLAQLAAKDNTPASVRQQMRFLGSPDERGQHELRLEGQL